MPIKKKGFVLLESIIALGFLLVLFDFGLSITFNNYSKSKLYYNYQDRKTLSFEENKVINNFNIYVNANIEEYNEAKKEVIEGKKEKIIYNDLEYKNYYVIINGKYINIVEEKSSQRRYVEIMENNKENEVYFIPTGYRIGFVMKG
ncbi:hypothetical protein [Clostridium sp.]|uniref:hypothetical protein n=1 Tax=Clostridium sp. TaxID=1506 RepID=UPI002614293C|nr:hypothetical protein [Clostridium sp.]